MVKATRAVRSGPAGAGLALAVLSAATFGTSGTFASALIRAGWSPAAAVIVRIAVSALILTVPALIQLRGRWGLLRRAAPRVAVYGLLAVAGLPAVLLQRPAADTGRRGAAAGIPRRGAGGPLGLAAARPAAAAADRHRRGRGDRGAGDGAQPDRDGPHRPRWGDVGPAGGGQASPSTSCCRQPRRSRCPRSSWPGRVCASGRLRWACSAWPARCR